MALRPRVAASLLIAVALTGCGGEPPPAPQPAPRPWFTDRAAEANLRFRHVNGMTGRRYIAEIMGPGVALLDYDNDGDLDVFLVQGGTIPSGGPPAGGRLFRNDLTSGEAAGNDPHVRRMLHFTDVTADSGLVTRGYGMGVTTGDFDNDGCVDLYVTNLGPNQLFRNNCDGTFTDVSKESGANLGGWSVPATFIDYDRDGWLDLFVGRYLNWTPAQEIRCVGPSGAADYCTPRSYAPSSGVLYHNNRNGTFTDVTRPAGLASASGPSLGVATDDFDGDGWLDLFVANDSAPNQLWINQHDGSFHNEALERGVALTANGRAESSMGVDAGDFDNDGDDDLFITEQTAEGHNLFVNDGHGHFEDRSEPSGLGPASLAYTGFGAAWIDIDNDGVLDLFTVNGAVQTIQRLAQAHDPFPLHQAKQVFRRRADGRFEDVTSRAGPALQVSDVSRGAAFGDIDNDGDTDVVVANNNGPVRLLVNEVGSQHHWLGLRLVGGRGGRAPGAAGVEGRDVVGTRVEVMLPDGTKRWRHARVDGSSASANDPRVLIGLGASASAATVHVRWTDGREETWPDVPADRYTTLSEGFAARPPAQESASP
jgi:hypothetical protein